MKNDVKGMYQANAGRTQIVGLDATTSCRVSSLIVTIMTRAPLPVLRAIFGRDIVQHRLAGFVHRLLVHFQHQIRVL